MPRSGLQTKFDAVYFFENFSGRIVRLDASGKATEHGV